MLIKAKAVAELLGGSKILGIEISDWSALERVVASRLPSATLEHLLERICLRNEQEYDCDRAEFGNYSARSGYLSVSESLKLETIARTYAFTLEVWGDESKARLFFHRPHPMLEGLSPFQASLSESGVKQVEIILGHILFGIFA